MYARVEARDLEPDTLAVGEIEKLGAATLTKIRAWVGHHQVVIQPVLNMASRDAVDSHDPPPWMRDLVTLQRQPLHLPPLPGRRQVAATSTTPSPTTRTDHPAKPGPRTSPALCRRHHRAKTSGRWRYLRTPDGDYTWHGPYDTTYLVTARGTRRLP